MKKLPRKLVWTLSVVGGLILVIAVGLRLFLPADKIRDMAVNMAGEKLGREIVVGDVGISFAGGLGVVLDEVQVANPAGFDGAPFLEAGRIDLKLQLAPLFRGAFQVNRLVVDEPRLRLVRRAGDVNNFTFEPPAQKSGARGVQEVEVPEPGTGMAISFDRLEFRRGTLTYRDEETDQGITLVGLDLAGSLTNPDPGVFRSSGLLEADSLLVAAARPVPALAAAIEFDLSFDTGHGALELTRGDLRINNLPLGLTGQVLNQHGELLAFGHVTAEEIDLRDLLAFLTPEQLKPMEPYTLEGRVSAVADLDFNKARPVPMEYAASATVAALRVGHPEFPGDLRAPEVRCEVKPDDLTVEARGTFADQPFEMTLAVKEFADPVLAMDVSGKCDLATFAPYLPPERQGVLAGRCELVGNVGGRAKNPEELDFKGRAVFTGVSYRDAILPDDIEHLTGTVSFSPDSVAVEKMAAEFGAGDLAGTGTLVDYLPRLLPSNRDRRDSLPKPDFTFAATSRRIDVDKLFPAAAPGATAAAPGAGKAAQTPAAAEPLPDFLCRGTIRADTLIYSRVPFTKVSGRVRLKDRILVCEEMTAGVYGGRAAGQVAIDLSDLNDPGYSGEYRAEGIEADNFLTRFAALKQVVYGKAGMAGSFTARGRTPDRVKNTLTLDSTASLTSGKVMTGEFMNSSLGNLAAQLGQTLDKEQALKDLTTLIKVENGRVGLDNLTTRLGSLGDLSLGGSYGFAGDLEYRGAILLSKEQTARLYASGGLVGSVAGLFGNQAERLSLPLVIGGTLAKPRMDLDYSELQSNIQSQLTDDLQEDLGKKLKGLFGK